jgi:hypothetical protein
MRFKLLDLFIMHGRWSSCFWMIKNIFAVQWLGDAYFQGSAHVHAHETITNMSSTAHVLDGSSLYFLPCTKLNNMMNSLQLGHDALHFQKCSQDLLINPLEMLDKRSRERNSGLYLASPELTQSRTNRHYSQLCIDKSCHARKQARQSFKFSPSARIKLVCIYTLEG